MLIFQGVDVPKGIDIISPPLPPSQIHQPRSFLDQAWSPWVDGPWKTHDPWMVDIFMVNVGKYIPITGFLWVKSTP